MPSAYPGPDLEIDGDLMSQDDESDTLAVDFEIDALPKKQRPLWQWIVTALVIAAMLFLALSQTLRSLTMPSLEFLSRSRILIQDPGIQRLRLAVAHLERSSTFQNKSFSQGTGFNIHPRGLIVTNRHLTEGASLITATLPDAGPYYSGEWVNHPRADLALVRLPEGALESDLPTIPVSRREPLRGEEVLVIGNPLGFARAVTEARVRSYGYLPTDKGPVRVMEIEGPIHPGNSGSPIVDEHGYAVGIVFARLPATDTLPDRGLAVLTHELDTLLSEVWP